MKITLADNDYLLLIPYEIKSETSLVVNNTDTKCMGKVAVDYISKWEDGICYKTGDIILFDVREAQKYVINNEEYIVIPEGSIIGGIIEEESNG